MRSHGLGPFLALLVAISAGEGHAHEDRLDSLRAAFHVATADTLRAKAASDLAEAYLGIGELDSALSHIRIGMRALEGEGRSEPSKQRWLMQLHKLKGIAHNNQARYDSALLAFQRMHTYAERLRLVPEMGAALTYQGYQFREMVDNDNALAMTRKAIGILKSLPTGPDMANAFHAMGMIHLDLGSTDSALYWSQKAAALYSALGKHHHLLNSYVNMGECLNTAGRWEEADSVWMLAAQLPEGLEDPMAYMHFAGGQARMLLRQGRVTEAIQMLDSAIILSKEMDQKHSEHYLLFIRSMAHANQSAWNAAMIDMMASLDAHATDMDYDKIRSTEAIRQHAEREKEQALAQAELSAQRMQKWGALVVGALAALLALVWYRSFKAKSRAADELRRKNEEIQRTQARLVASEKQREAEQVRTRIARDIHDEIGATLTKIRLLSDVAATNTPEQLPDTQRSLQRIGAHVRHVSGAMSDIVWAVDPARDTHQGMLDHVRELSRRILGDNGITFDLDLSCTVGIAVMEPDLRRDLHLLINEAYNNILKYAKAKHVRTRLKLNSYLFELDIEDDGIGFDPSLVHGAGNGLRNMRERAARYEGKLRISSEPGKGTRITGEGRF